MALWSAGVGEGEVVDRYTSGVTRIERALFWHEAGGMGDIATDQGATGRYPEV